MTSTSWAAPNVMLDAAPSALQALVVLLLVGLVVTREAARVRDPLSRAAVRLTIGVRLLAPAALALLAVRLLVILQ